MCGLLLLENPLFKEGLYWLFGIQRSIQYRPEYVLVRIVLFKIGKHK